MGWKASIVVGKAGVDWTPSAGNFTHDERGVSELASQLGIRVASTLRHAPLIEGIYTDEGEISLLAGRPLGEGPATQGGGLVMAAIGDVLEGGNQVAEHAAHPYVQGMVRLFPRGVVAALELHSVTDYWGFALYERGKLVRALSGSADDGIIVEEGQRIAEEGRRTDDEFDGESCVFAVSKRIFGRELWEEEVLNWECTIVKAATEKRKKPWWKVW